MKKTIKILSVFLASIMFFSEVTQGTVLCVDKNKQNLLKYCRGESNAKASKNNE